jgi:hypothetical protein
MKVTVISYSFTGNNDALAASLAARLSAKHVKITEEKPRTMGTIIFDMLLNRTPKINLPRETFEQDDVILFVGPVWMGQIATPLRTCFKQLRPKIGRYAFISISGGALGSNPKLAGELKKRLGTEPVAVIDLHIADLLPPDPKPARKDTSAYRITANDITSLTETIVATLQKTMGNL